MQKPTESTEYFYSSTLTVSTRLKYLSVQVFLITPLHLFESFIFFVILTVQIISKI